MLTKIGLIGTYTKVRVAHHGVHKGVEYWVLTRINGLKSKPIIIVRCPRCGKLGKLTRYRNRFRITHNVRGDAFCNIGSLNEYVEPLKDLYYRYKAIEVIA